MRAEQFKKILTTVGSVLSSLLGILYIPVMLMVLCNIIDYTTGLMAAKYRKDSTISSYKSFKGIAKKVSMWLLVVVGAIVDELIKYATQTVGITVPFTFLIACVVAVWLICNELISILENIKDIGVNIPTFLLPLVKNIKSQTESAVNIEDEESEE
nr:MAG TPA: holin [Caudoviricetes sp.]